MSPPPVPPRSRAGEVFAAFLTLGPTSFGGPVAHLGCFREEFVARPGWLDDRAYADLVALCQFLPGPASSQPGGFRPRAHARAPAGCAGGLPRFHPALGAPARRLRRLGCGRRRPGRHRRLRRPQARGRGRRRTGRRGDGPRLCPDAPRATLALAAVVVVVALRGPVYKVAAIGIGAAVGALLLRQDAAPAPAATLLVQVGPRAGLGFLLAFAVLLVALPLGAGTAPALALVDAFYRADSLVFGGGHVVLPLLQAEVVGPGLVAPDAFLSGHGAAEAVPGPLFTFAACLGFVMEPGANGLDGAALALAAVFLPGFLVLLGVLPFRARLRARQGAQATLAGANAAAVGILDAALHTPLFTSAVTDLRVLALALACFVLLVARRAPARAVVLAGSADGAGLALLPG